MIKLFVRDYCHECRYFKPFISDRGYKPDRTFDTLVCCENEPICEYVRDDLKRSMGENKND